MGHKRHDIKQRAATLILIYYVSTVTILIFGLFRIEDVFQIHRFIILILNVILLQKHKTQDINIFCQPSRVRLAIIDDSAFCHILFHTLSIYIY